MIWPTDVCLLLKLSEFSYCLWIPAHNVKCSLWCWDSRFGWLWSLISVINVKKWNTRWSYSVLNWSWGSLCLTMKLQWRPSSWTLISPDLSDTIILFSSLKNTVLLALISSPRVGVGVVQLEPAFFCTCSANPLFQSAFSARPQAELLPASSRAVTTQWALAVFRSGQSIAYILLQFPGDLMVISAVVTLL